MAKYWSGLQKAIFIIAISALAATALYSRADAQEVKPPPRYDDTSPTGVSYREGSFTYSDADLSIGGGLPTGLSLTRSYNSASIPISDPFGATIGWTQSLNLYINMQVVPYLPADPQILEWRPPSEFDRCIVNVSAGSKSYGFHNTTRPPPPTGNWGYETWLAQLGCGFEVGTYITVGNHDAKLEYTASPSPGRYKLTSSDGAIAYFSKLGGPPRITDSTMPDGTRLDFTYSNGRLKSVFSNRGWAILMESEYKICAVNTALTYITPTSACPSDAQTVTYGYATGVANPFIKRLTSVTKAGETTQYEYDSADRLNCVKAPGQTTCRIFNIYASCPVLGPGQPDGRASAYVTSQTDASGRTFSYGYNIAGIPNGCPFGTWDPGVDTRPFSEATTTVTESGVAGQSLIVTSPSKQVTSVTDPLGRVTNYGYEQTTLGDYTEDGELKLIQRDEGNSEEYSRDARGNITRRTVKAKPGSGLSDLVTQANYPATCTNIVTCNKPTSIVDAGNAVTDYSYDPVHGGVLTETSPANASGVRAVKRSSYVQRTPWVKAAAGGFVPTNPIWVLDMVKTCATTATINGGCAGGAADEIITRYDYGPDAGPNNLLLRGMTVTAGGVTLRTCYGYDRDGRKISETTPNAQLTSCP